MISPVLSNFIVQFGENFFPLSITEKYDKFLYARNYPLKDMRSYLHETIQIVSIPGEQLNILTMSGLNNTRLSGKPGKSLYDLGNALDNGTDVFTPPVTTRQYAGNDPQSDLLESLTLTVTFKNSVLNWLYMFEWFYKYYKRNRGVSEFDMNLIMMDSAQIPIIKFYLSDIFVSKTPGLEFAYNASFNESKTFDLDITFNKFDIEVIIPGYDTEILNLR